MFARKTHRPELLALIICFRVNAGLPAERAAMPERPFSGLMIARRSSTEAAPWGGATRSRGARSTRLGRRDSAPDWAKPISSAGAVVQPTRPAVDQPPAEAVFPYRGSIAGRQSITTERPRCAAQVVL